MLNGDIKQFTERAEKLLTLATNARLKVDNIELGELISSTRADFLSLSVDVKQVITSDPSEFLDAIDDIEDCIGINGDFTRSSLMFNAHKFTQFDKYLSSFNELSLNAKQVNSTQDLDAALSDAQYETFAMFNSGESTSIYKKFDALLTSISSFKSNNKKIVINDDYKASIKDIKHSLGQFQSGELSQSGLVHKLQKFNSELNLSEMSNKGDLQISHSSFENSLKSAVKSSIDKLPAQSRKPSESIKFSTP
ncbi:hypothetical protein VCHA53O466_40047 [Vibrio chagasii]|nr:hypothetical protein VCHA53O466_40047 [Vibrio chagasii]